MRFSILDLFVPGVTNMIDMSTGVFRNEDYNKNASTLRLSQQDLIYYLLDLGKDKIDLLLNEVKEENIAQIRKICSHNHKLFIYLFNVLKTKDEDRILKVKNYLKSHPCLKKFLHLYKNKLKKKKLYLTRKKLIKEYYIRSNKKIKGHKFSFYIEFNEIETINTLEYYYKYKYSNYQSFTIYLLVNNKKYRKLSKTWEYNYN